MSHVTPFPQLLAAAVGSSLIAAAAYRLRALTSRGAWAAAACGTILYGAGGWPWVALVGAFFVTSSALTRLESLGARRGGQSRDRAGRDWTQVVANGGAAAITALAYGVTGSALCLVAGAGAVAVATADTWATEIGRFSGSEPRILTTWRRAPRGASGGVTGLGVLGGCAGAGLIALVGAAFVAPPAARVAAAVAIAGISGSLVDSILGATVEQRWHWITNNTVNFVATAWGAIAAAALVR